jgi:hypothetical protein
VASFHCILLFPFVRPEHSEHSEHGATLAHPDSGVADECGTETTPLYRGFQ